MRYVVRCSTTVLVQLGGIVKVHFTCDFSCSKKEAKAFFKAAAKVAKAKAKAAKKAAKAEAAAKPNACHKA